MSANTHNHQDTSMQHINDTTKEENQNKNVQKSDAKKKKSCKLHRHTGTTTRV